MTIPESFTGSPEGPDANNHRRSMRALSTDDAWSRLRSKSVGRLSIAPGGLPDVVPLNFLMMDGQILLRTRGGYVVAALAVNKHVAFEVDELAGTDIWSVVVRGTAKVIADPAEIDRAQRAPMWTWPDRETDTFIRITPAQVTGRRFVR
jgi:nitroimidazol reductase NimA-like FMN-containing flavoprotein (pyridoxamine 5'-phosphate oxidase superfamily)